MTAYFCRECLVNEVPPTARDGRCSLCRPSRRHSRPRPLSRGEIDEAFRRLTDQHNTSQ